MKSLLILPVIALVSFSFRSFPHSSKNIFFTINDTGIINHILDGSIDEWPAEKFEQGKGTNIKYAVDNDAKNLYIAMVIPNFPTQMKMMRQGMNLYIDLKGKKKQGRGIEFPVKKDRSNFNEGNFSSNSGNRQGNNESNTERQKPDMKQMRGMMTLNLLSMKLFGFTDDEPKEQGLIMPGSVNIQFNWDEANIMYIEYDIPLNLLGDNASLNQKNISLGWKLNDADVQTTTPVSSTSTIQGRPAGSSGRNGSFGNSGTSRPSQQGMDKMMSEESFWTKYTISISER